MALIRVHNDFLNDAFLRKAFVEAFDTIEPVVDEGRVTLFRVHHAEVPKEDVLIRPSFYSFKGVQPFVIEWD